LCGEAIISENVDPLFDVCSLILAWWRKRKFEEKLYIHTYIYIYIPNFFLWVYLAARAGADSDFKKITGRTDDVAVSPRSVRSDNQVGTSTFVLA
jgi:hypothetical protein